MNRPRFGALLICLVVSAAGGECQSAGAQSEERGKSEAVGAAGAEAAGLRAPAAQDPALEAETLSPAEQLVSEVSCFPAHREI